MTFSAPKSVSIQALVWRDAAIIAAHDEAVGRALVEVGPGPRLAADRRRLPVEATGELIIAKFRYETTRAQERGTLAR